MTQLIDPRLKQVGPPRVFARMVRRMYLTFFAAPIFCAAAAVCWAVGHQWVYAAGFAASALLYLPVSLSQYRRSRTICEEAIRQYRALHREQTGTEG